MGPATRDYIYTLANQTHPIQCLAAPFRFCDYANRVVKKNIPLWIFGSGCGAAVYCACERWLGQAEEMYDRS